MSADDHGAYSTYTNHKCRCDECRAANAAWHRGRRVRRAGEAATMTLPHGRISTYTNWGCRCTECRAAQAAASASRRRPRRAWT